MDCFKMWGKNIKIIFLHLVFIKMHKLACAAVALSTVIYHHFATLHNMVTLHCLKYKRYT